MWQEALSDEDFDKFFRQGFVVLAGVADIGEDLCQRLLVVDADKVTVLFQFLFIFIIGVDILAYIVVVGFLMNEALQGQTV